MARAALVTGGSSGIGFAIARALRDEGLDVSVASRRAEKVEAAAAELGAHGVVADVAEEVDCVRLVAQHIERFGRLDVLVNSAGVGIESAAAAIEARQLDLQLAVNLRGLMLVTREALPHLREHDGWIVNLASILGLRPEGTLAVYSATKAAVISFTGSLNRTEHEHGVRACALCPAFVDTPMAEWSGIPNDEMIRPADCAEVVRMLLRLGPRARVPQVVLERVGAGFAAP